MSDDTTAQSTETETEPDEEPPSRIAGALVTLVLVVAALLVLRLIVTHFPYVAYFVAGVIVCLAWQKARAWITRRRGDEAEAEEEEPDVGEALRDLSKGEHHVLLSALRKRLGVADTKAVRALLKAERIDVRAGVRTPKGNGPGVHMDDIPSAPSESDGEHPGGCCCRSANNTNANSETSAPSQKGLRVEAIGIGGKVIHAPDGTAEPEAQPADEGFVDRFFAAAEELHLKKTSES